MRSKRDERWLGAAAKIADLSVCRQKHGAIIVSGNRMLAASPNVFRNSPLIVSDPKSQSTLHAEVAALRILNYRIPRRSTMYIARVTPQGRMALSAPCDSCAAVLEDFGMLDVVWTE